MRINELMASNTRAYPDITDFEDYPDWIELKNHGASSTNLNGHFLSDDPGDPFKWPVPASATIPANGFLMIMADGHDTAPGAVFPRGYWPWKDFTTGKYHTNFNLGASGETVTLTRATGLSTVSLVNASVPNPAAAAVWKYLDNGTDQSTQWRARDFNDSAWAAGPSELGYADSPATNVSFGPSSGDKYITTYFRHSFTVDNPAAYHGLSLKLLVDDGCVIYLNGAEVVRRNMPIGEPGYRTLADYSVGSGDSSEESVFHPYTLPVSGLVAGINVLAVEVHQASAGSADLSFDLSLEAASHTGYETADTVTYPQQVSDISYGRDNLNPLLLKQFSEATPGAENTAAAVDDVRLTGAAVTVSLPGGLYATNQSVTLTSPGGAIHYTLGGRNPHRDSPLYSGPIPITATTVLRARCFEDGKAPGPIVTRTYFRGETMANVAYVSVVADPETLFGNAIGIYTNQHETVTGGYGLKDVYKGKDAPGNVEFFDPRGGGFSAGCGIRIGGENNWVHPQKALNIAIRGKYGDDDVTYDLFPGTQVPVHTGFTLRDGGDNWNKDMLRDALYPKLAKGFLNVDTAAYRPSVVFINGAYYGLHDVRQRWDDMWFAQQYHIPADKIDHLLYGHITSAATTLGVDKGTSDDWLALIAFIATADLTAAANWAYVESKIDMDSYMDFVISESYGNNTSWHHNREFWKEKSPGSKWRWFLTDMDRTFFTSSLTGVLADILNSGDELMIHFKTNTAFKKRLAQRYAAHMASTFKPARVDAVLSQMDTEVAALVPRHVTRWAPDGTTVSARNSNIQQIKDYAVQRAANFAAEVSTQLGAGTAMNFTLGVNNAAQGAVLVQGVPVAASTFRMFPNAAFTLQAVPSPGYAFSGWTGASGGETLTVTLTAARTISANFIPSGETVIGGTLTGDTTLALAGSPYTLAGDLLVPSGLTLSVEAGVLIRMPALRNIRVQGVLEINGTASRKVTINGRDGARWGGISFETPSGPSHLAHLVIRGATKGFDATRYSSAVTGYNADVTADFLDIAESEGPFYMYGGTCTVRDSILSNPYTGDGLHVKRGLATVRRCTFPGNNAPDTDAIDFDGVPGGLIEDCRIYRFQGSNSDGIDLGEACSNLLVQGNLIYYNSDKGFSVGQGSTVTLRRNLVVGCALGVGIKDTGSSAVIDQNTFVSCTNGVAVYEKNFGAGGGSAILSNTIVSKASELPVSVDGFSTLTASYCLSDTLPIPGAGNQTADPQFIDPAALNFQLQSTSPAIDAGDPAHAPDPDGSIVDIGPQYLYSVQHYPYTIGETVVINEVLANSGAGSDWIELHNRTNAAIDIGGWFLSDSGTDLAKYRIPVGTVIGPGGYVTFYESTNFGAASVDPNKVTAFALSDVGETVHLNSASADQLTDYHSKEDFGPSLEGESLGVYYKPSSDSYNFVAMSAPTPGTANSGPRNGPIVISEIMYHPSSDGDAEYFELLNISNAPVTLYDPLKEKAWRISEGITYEFPASPPVTMAPGERIVLTRNIARFNIAFGAAVPIGTKVLEWTTGGLSNGGENLQLDRPGAVDALNIQQYVRQDRVNYSDLIPWPSTPDGSGPSLTKLSEKDYGNDFINWTAAAASPGAMAPGNRFAAWAATHGVTGSGDPDHDGVDNLLEYAFGTNPQAPDSTNPALVLTMGPKQNSISYEVDASLPDLDYLLEVSSDLTLWTPVDSAPVSLTEGKQTRLFEDSALGFPRHFYRLGIKLKP
ncbi:MAG: hypothetical protein EOP86_09030 [Verrucomicrobiaceae bacterium]|nr:MAG: hypothetical protein EOP86_09030 [Verrucomicrobiaceae bacterium]